MSPLAYLLPYSISRRQEVENFTKNYSGTLQARVVIAATNTAASNRRRKLDNDTGGKSTTSWEESKSFPWTFADRESKERTKSRRVWDAYARALRSRKSFPYRK